MIRNFLAHPLTRGMEIDAPETTALRKEIIQSKPFLRQIYQEWYQLLAAALPGELNGPVIEFGSGGGFLEQFIPGLITSEIFFLPNIRLVMDAQALPLPESTLRGIVGTNVFHHLPQAQRFLAEAQRCLKPGGVIALIEPWVSQWSSLVYSRLHEEPFAPQADQWDFPASGPLSGANNALPWIVFERDRLQFEKDHPGLRLRKLTPFMPFRYLVSGGVSMRSLMPGATFPVWRWLEMRLEDHMHDLAMFAQIVIERVK